MIGLGRAMTGVILICALTSCVAPGARVPDTQVKRGEDLRALYLPSIARSPLPARQFLPRVGRNVVWKQFLPSILKNHPVCAAYGGDCAEPNDTRSLAVKLTELNRPYFGAVFTGTLDAYDFFVVSLSANQRYTLTLAGGVGPGTPFTGQNDADLYLYDSVGIQLQESTAYGQVAEQILFTPTASGTYYLLAFGYLTPVGPAAYRLEARDRP